MQKKPDRLPATELPQTFGEWDQVIIVHPHQIAGGQHRHQRPRESAVDPHVPGKIAPRIADQRRPVMKQRPQHAVGEADVVLLVIAPAQIEGGGGDVAIDFQAGGFARPLGYRSAIAEPDAAGLFECGPDRYRQAALSRFAARDRPNPIGDDDKPARGSCGRPHLRCGSCVSVAAPLIDDRTGFACHLRTRWYRWFSSGRRFPFRPIHGHQPFAAALNQFSASATEGRLYMAALGAGAPTRIEAPARRFTSAKPSSSVMSSPINTARRPRNGGSARKAAITAPLLRCRGCSSKTILPAISRNGPLSWSASRCTASRISA